MKPTRFVIAAFVFMSLWAVWLAAQETPQRSLLADRFTQLDRNGDGKISADEFPGPQFKQMDKNDDGFVTLGEVKAFYGSSARRRQGNQEK